MLACVVRVARVARGGCPRREKKRRATSSRSPGRLLPFEGFRSSLLAVPDVTARRLPLVRFPALQGAVCARPDGVSGSRRPPRPSGFLPGPRGSSSHAVPRVLSFAGSSPRGLRRLFRVLAKIRPAALPLVTGLAAYHAPSGRLLPWGLHPHRDITPARPPSASIPGPLRSALGVSHPLGGLLRAFACGLVSCRSHVQGFQAPTYRGFAPPRTAAPPLGGRCLRAASPRARCRRLAPPAPRARVATSRLFSVRGRVHVASGFTRPRRCAPLLAFPSSGLSLSSPPPSPFESGILPRASKPTALRSRLLRLGVSRCAEPGLALSSPPSLSRFHTSSASFPFELSAVSVSSERPASRRAPFGLWALRVACQVSGSRTCWDLGRFPLFSQRTDLVHSLSTICGVCPSARDSLGVSSFTG